jgi:hypothetical protein
MPTARKVHDCRASRITIPSKVSEVTWLYRVSRVCRVRRLSRVSRVNMFRTIVDPQAGGILELFKRQNPKFISCGTRCNGSEGNEGPRVEQQQHLQWCSSGVPVVFQWCYSGVTVLLQ